MVKANITGPTYDLHSYRRLRHPNPARLSRQEATRRLQTEGPNQLPKPNQRKFLRILRDVLQEPMFMLLIGGGWCIGC